MSLQKLLKVVGNNIKLFRLRGELSQEKLAKKAGISRSTVQSAEAGKSIEFEHILKIAEALGIHPADLFLTDEDRQITYKAKLFWEALMEYKSNKGD